MRAGIVVGLLAVSLSAAAPAQQTMPPGYVDYVADGIQWKFVSADRQHRLGTVFTDGPSEFAPFFITCRGGQGTLTFTLAQGVDIAQTGKMLRLSLKGRAIDIRVTRTENMGMPALQGTFELASLAPLAQGSTATDMIEVAAGYPKMGYAARDFAAAFSAFRQACTGLKP
jgi:hypothetical protein